MSVHRVSTLALVLFLGLAAAPTQAQTNALIPAATQRTALAPDQAATLTRLEAQPTTARFSFVTVRLDAIEAETATRFDLGWEAIVLPAAVLTRRAANDASWLGHTADYRTTANLVIRAEGVTGSIRTPRGLYQLRPLGNGLHALIEVDETAFPPDHPADYEAFLEAHGQHTHAAPLEQSEAHPVPHPPHQGRSSHDRQSHQDDRHRSQHHGQGNARQAAASIGVVVAYTPSARSEAGGTANIEALAQLAVDETNTAYTASGILASLSLVHIYETTDDNSSDFGTDLNDFTVEGGSNTKFDGIETLRDTFGGDFAVLLRGTGSSCGLAWIESDTAFAFSVTAWDCATGNYTFGHELGHNVGARHHTANDPTETPFVYGHGYIDGPNDFGTIMHSRSNSNACPGNFCTRIQRFSAPDQPFNGNATGDEALRNVARVTNQRANTIASFKGSAVAATLSATGGPIEVGLTEGTSTTASVMLSNTGDGTLYYEAATRQEDGSVPAGTANYTYATSDDVGGPAASFTDITGTGTQLYGGIDSNEVLSTVSLPFSFPYFGVSYTSIRVSDNGFVTVDTGFNSATRTPEPLPSLSAADGVIAAYWADHFLWSTASSSMYYQDMMDGRFIVQWDNIARVFGSGSISTSRLGTFQLILHSDGTIEFQYDDLEGTANDFTGVTIGLENGDNTKGLLLDYLDGFAKDNFAIEFTPTTEWLSFTAPAYGAADDVTTDNFSVSIDATGLGAGTYTGAITVTSNGTGTALTTVPITLNVLGTDYTFQDGFGWRMLAAPEGATTVADLAGQNLVQGVPGSYPTAATNLYVGYDGTGFVAPSASSETIGSGQGFLWYLYDNDLDPDGSDPNNSESIALPMTISFEGSEPSAAVNVPALHADGDGWNLLGNPFAATLDVSSIGTWSGTATLASNVGQMWQCTPDASPTVECVGSYVTTTTASDEVPVWQGVFYQASGAGTLEVPLTARGTSQSREAAAPLVAFRLDATDATSGLRRTDQAAVLYLAEGAVEGAGLWDAEKLTPLTYPYVALAFEQETEAGPRLLAQDGRPLDMIDAYTIPLVVEAVGVAGSATLTWPQATLPEGWRVFLTDRVTGASVSLDETDAYAFELSGGGAAAASEGERLGIASRAGVSLRSAAAAPRFELLVLPPGAVASETDTTPLSFALDAPYPNPVAGDLNVSYTLPEASFVQLTVYDVLGREIAVLASASRTAGTWQAVWPTPDIAPGVYVLRLEAEQGVQTRKVTVAR
ncbi:MAG: M12 family metallo-peptidase [Bacteroidota bacterium]